MAMNMPQNKIEWAFVKIARRHIDKTADVEQDRHEILNWLDLLIEHEP
jgi:hypothetical protein